MFFVHDSKKIYYRAIGTGNPLVIIHGGLGMDHRYLYEWFLPLSNHFQLIFIDLPGNGLSSRIRKVDPFSVEYLSDVLEALRNKIIKKKIFLLGHSYGGFVATVYAIRYPKMLKKLIVANGSLDISSQNDDLLIASKKTSQQK